MGKVELLSILYSFLYSIRIFGHLNSSGRLFYKKELKGDIHVLGNGPSLKEKLKEYRINSDIVSFAVNDFAVSDFYSIVKPSYYMLVDPAYWIDNANMIDMEIREKVYQNMNERTIWPMTLFVPSYVKKKKIMEQFVHNSNIIIRAINYTNFYPTKTWYYKYILKHNFGVVPVGNILGQAIYASINMGFKNIYIYGAEHSWTEDIRVNDKNQVCTIKKHFFDAEEQKLVPWLKANGDTFKMHEVLASLRNHFLGYHFLEWYSKQMGAHILNCTTGSFIDAFERRNGQNK